MNIASPFDSYRAVVKADWIDHNEHMNMGYYLVTFDYATEAWFDFIGLDQNYRQHYQATTFSLEAHITYQREVRLGDRLRFTTRLLAFDQKRIHYFHQMYHAEHGYLAASNELMTLHVSKKTRRAAAMADSILQRLASIQQAHDSLPETALVGRVIGLNATPTTQT